MEVTAQAAEKAATGVKELAERSSRIALNVHFNAPVIFLPQSSSSSNVIVADLGLLSVKNRFAKQPYKRVVKIPPVVDIMTVRLTNLKMYRSEAEHLKEISKKCGWLSFFNICSLCFFQDYIYKWGFSGRDTVAGARQSGLGNSKKSFFQLVPQHT